MRDDERCTAFHELYHSFLNTHFRTGIDAGGCFVQNQNFRIGKNRSRNGKKLSLTVTDVAARFRKHGLITFGHSVDETVSVCRCRCLAQLIFCGVRFAVTDVGFDGICEQYGILQNNGNVFAQRIFCNIFDIFAVE